VPGAILLVRDGDHSVRLTAGIYRGLLSGRLLRVDLLTATKTTISDGDKVDIPGSAMA
jgi:hypothetical protein